MSAPVSAGFVPAGSLVLARMANMVLGLATIPILVHSLGGEGFGAWAILLAMGIAFSGLEFGMSLTFIRHAAPLIERRRFEELGRLASETVLVLLLAFGAAAPLLLLLDEPLARLLQLPAGQWMSAAGAMNFVLLGVAARSILQLGSMALNAARHFREVAVISFAQSLLSNAAAICAAEITHRFDAALLAFWSAQLLVSATGLARARCVIAPRLHLHTPSLVRARALFAHGARIQTSEWAQIINFQFDKFLIVSWIGLGAVLPYEVANRSVLALRSLPSSGLDSFLSFVAVGREAGTDLWAKYQSALRVAGAGVLLFMIAPLAFAPPFLFAWTGEAGYSARWPFFFLLLGGAASVLAIPAIAVLQATARANVQAKAALISVALNLPLSIVMVLHWGIAGAAAGTGIAMTFSAYWVSRELHRQDDKDMLETFRGFRGFVPAFSLCILVGLVVHVGFHQFLAVVDPGVRFLWRTRAWIGIATITTYAVGVFAFVADRFHRGSFLPEHYAWLARRAGRGRFGEYCLSRAAH